MSDVTVIEVTKEQGELAYFVLAGWVLFIYTSIRSSQSMGEHFFSKNYVKSWFPFFHETDEGKKWAWLNIACFIYVLVVNFIFWGSVGLTEA